MCGKLFIRFFLNYHLILVMFYIYRHLYNYPSLCGWYTLSRWRGWSQAECQNSISHNAPVYLRMLTGFEHLPRSPLPTLMLAKMVVRA